ncbi:MAG: hypothetical protein V4736_09365 [Bdellovibrionota bacterium]
MIKKLVIFFSLISLGGHLTGCSSASKPEEKDLKFVVKGEMPYIEQRFQECYRIQYEKDPTLRGRVKIKFSINEDGKPFDFSEVKQDLAGKEQSKKALMGCVKDVLLASQFQSMGSLGEDFFEIQYPINFKTGP